MRTSGVKPNGMVKKSKGGPIVYWPLGRRTVRGSPCLGHSIWKAEPIPLLPQQTDRACRQVGMYKIRFDIIRTRDERPQKSNNLYFRSMSNTCCFSSYVDKYTTNESVELSIKECLCGLSSRPIYLMSNLIKIAKTGV